MQLHPRKPNNSFLGTISRGVEMDIVLAFFCFLDLVMVGQDPDTLGFLKTIYGGVVK